eukprot:gene16779-22964_t
MSDGEEEVEYTQELIHIAEHQFLVTTVDYLPLTKLLANHCKDVEISGQKVWCGSLGVCQYLKDNASIEQLSQSIIIELGAGTGVLGMMCKRMGANRVYLTDHDAISLKHMLQDCIVNEIDATVIRLDWFHPIIDTLELNQNADNRHIIIVAGDVLYKQVLLDPFFNTVANIFEYGKQSRLTVELILCHVPRAGVEHVQVMEKACQFGFDIRTFESSTWMEGDCMINCPREDSIRAKLYVIKLS